MSTYSDLQQELMMLWNSRVKDIEGLKETGRRFSISKPMHHVINSSQKNYRPDARYEKTNAPDAQTNGRITERNE